MTHATRFVAAVVLVALALCVPVQAQTPEIDELRVRADQGNATAQYDLGVMYANGLGVPEDDAEAVRWYRLAAEQGNVDAQSALGFIYATGRGVPLASEASSFSNLGGVHLACSSVATGDSVLPAPTGHS